MPFLDEDMAGRFQHCSQTTATDRIAGQQPYTQAAAGSTWGKYASTLSRTVGLGTNRQIQFAFRLNF